MGPGLHSQVEAEVFGARFPHVLFSDQPQDCNFQELSLWAQELIREQYLKSGQKLTLLGHSFGSQVLTAALPRVSECVKEIRMLNSTYDSFDSFAALDMELFPQSAKDFAFWKDRPVEEKMILIFKLASDPRFTSVYWNDSRSRARYEAVAMTKPGLNISTFLKVFRDYLSQPKPALVWNGPVKAFFSLQDAMIREPSVIAAWKDVYPNVQMCEVSGCGHYMHFESEDVANVFFGI